MKSSIETKVVQHNFVLSVIACALFVIDLTIPLGVAAGVPYVTVILIALMANKPSVTFFWAVACTLLTLAGYYLSPDGGEVWKVVSNRLLAIYAIWSVVVVSLVLLKKVQKLSSLENELQLSEFRSTLGEVAEYATDAIVITNARGLITWVNKGFTKISGYELDEVIGKKPGDLLQGKETDLDDVQCLSNAIRAEQPIELEIINYHKNGTPYWIDLSINPIKENGKLVRFVAVERDITDRKKLELSLSNGVVTATQATNTKSRFMTLLTHELAAPINQIIEHSKTIQSETGACSSKHYSSEIEHLGQTLHAIIRNIVALSAIEVEELNIKTKPFNLHGVIEGIKEDLEQLATYKNIEFDYVNELEASNNQLGDRELIHHILYFFALNGVTQTQVERVTFAAQSRNQQIKITLKVCDNGLGYRQMRASNTSLSHNNQEVSVGVASGYKLACKIAEKIQGHITLEHLTSSNETCVTVSLPLEKVVSQPIPSTQQTKRILIAEDNRVNAMVLTKFLRSIGFEDIDLAKDGAEAVNLAKHNDYFAILMDNHMPVMTGIEATGIIISQINPAANIIACTADVSAEAKQDFFDSGARDIIFKPVNKQKLVDALHENNPIRSVVGGN